MAKYDPAQWMDGKVDESAALRRLARIEQRARLIIAFETIWPTFVAILSLLGSAAILTLVGVIEFFPPPLRAIGFAMIVASIIALVVRVTKRLHQSREDVLERIDQRSDLAHRPALALADSSATHLDDPLTRALWRAHRIESIKNIGQLHIGWPHPRVVDRDPYALRFAVLLGLIAALIVTGDTGIRRFDSAFIFTKSGEAAAQARLDGWINPPAYTGIAPIMFDFKSDEPIENIRVPSGSILVLRRSDNVIALPSVTGDAKAERTDQDNEIRYRLDGVTHITAPRISLKIDIIPDMPPSIALIGNPQKTQSGSINLNFHSEDDYGVASGTTRIFNPRRNDQPLLGQHEPLIPAPEQPMMPSGDKRNSDGRVTLDQIKSPWAGATVDIALLVKDDLGQSAEAGYASITLPSRRFTMPVAKALIEERQRLALDPATLPRVRESIDLMLVAPELFGVSAADYLALREIRTALETANSTDEFKGLIDLMWNIALTIERGGSDDAEKALNRATEALRDALANGASDEDIKALTDKLKDALDAYLKDYAARALKEMQQAGRDPQSAPNARTIRPEDLKSMLDRMQDMAKHGARDDAARMLDALDSVLKNLQASRPQFGDPAQNKGAQTLDGLDKMLRDQRGLRDDTYKQGRANPDTGKALGDRQQALRNELDQMRNGLKDLEQDGQDALGHAGDAMKRAEQDLQRGDIAGALREQNKALEGLRAGAQALGKQMLGENGDRNNADGPNSRDRERFGQSTREDPLGRQNGANVSEGGTVNENGGAKSAGERARNVLNELRKRLSEDDRSKDERDYFRRLIGPN